MQLQPKTLLIASLKADSTSESASAIYNEITSLLTFKKRKTTYRLDNLQTDSANLSRITTSRGNWT